MGTTVRLDMRHVSPMLRVGSQVGKGFRKTQKGGRKTLRVPCGRGMNVVCKANLRVVAKWRPSSSARLKRCRSDLGATGGWWCGASPIANACCGM